MNLAPETTTIAAQRSTELLLLDYLRSTNPHLYALWCHHPDYNKPDADSSSSSATTESSRSHSPSSVLNEESQQAETDAAAAAHEGSFHYQEAQLHRAAHIAYASTHIQDLFSSLQGTYPSRPWVAYWCLQAADMLGGVQSDVFARTPAADITAFLYSCLSHDKACEAELNAADAETYARVHSAQKGRRISEDETSNSDHNATECVDAAARPAIGFAGGPVHQWPHLAASYAACCALAVLSVYDKGASLRRLPRSAIKRWLLALRNDDGSFRIHGGGETDIRASYCAAVITSLLCLDDPSTFDAAHRHSFEDDCDDVDSGTPLTQREFVDDVQYEPVLTLQTAKFVAACQTHEGGFACSATASEAHGAYTQCGLAALLLMKQPHLVHQASLRRWLAARQLNCEGGFNGRTNKLVDSCYSHWIGASHVLLRTVEAYVKCFAPYTDGETGDGETLEYEREKTGTDVFSSSPYLLAKEVVLLDHAQLLDAERIQATENAAWDRAEAAHFTAVDLVDEFLSADDSCFREASAKRSALSALYDDILRADSASNSGKNDKEGNENMDARIRDFHKHQAFLYADVGDYHFNQRKLQDYVLRCCQDKDVGGLMDKPGTAHDAYHTCYSLCGISSAQNLQYVTHAVASTTQNTPTPSNYLERAFAQSYLPKQSTTNSYGVVLSIPSPSAAAEMSVLQPTNPIFNLHQSVVKAALRVWGLKSFL